MKNYTPYPGSVPARVIAWLAKNHPDGAKVPGQVICEELGVATTSMGAVMSRAVRAGLVSAEKRELDSRTHQCFGLGGFCVQVPDARIAARAVAQLKQWPPGTQVKTCELADALGVEPALLQNLRKQFKGPVLDKLRAQRASGHGMALWWSLSAFEPIEPELEESESMPPRRHAPEIQPRPGPWFPGVNVQAMA